MLPGIICTIKIGKLCRCYCLSRGINAYILIFSAAGSCWMPSGWFSHPPGTPGTASAHGAICKTFFSWCQHYYSGKVRTLYWITSSTDYDLVPLTNTSSLSNKWLRCNILPDLSTSCRQTLFNHGFNFLTIHCEPEGPARSIYTLSLPCMPPASNRPCALIAISLPWHASSYLITSNF